MAIYTKTGDKGITGTFKGCRVNKDTPLMEAIGVVDELNSLLGLALSFGDKKNKENELFGFVRMVQEDLFRVGAILAGNHKELGRKDLEGRIQTFEREIDLIWEKLPLLKNFVFPRGTYFAATLFLARAVCRRAERRVVSLKEFPRIVVYLNRLSDYLFVLGRYANFLKKEKETVWTG